MSHNDWRSYSNKRNCFNITKMSLIFISLKKMFGQSDWAKIVFFSVCMLGYSMYLSHVFLISYSSTLWPPIQTSVCLSSSSSCPCLYPQPQLLWMSDPAPGLHVVVAPLGPRPTPIVGQGSNEWERVEKKTEQKKKEKQLLCVPGHWVSPRLVKPNQEAILQAIRSVASKTPQRHMQTDRTPRSCGEEKNLSGVLAGFIGGLTKSALRQSLKTDARTGNGKLPVKVRVGDRDVWFTRRK